mgnify:CR=1 FL=1
MKKNLIPILVLFLSISFITESLSQRTTRRRTSEREREQKEESVPLKEKINTEIKVGNLNFFGSVFSLSLKSNVGYKFNKTFTAGAGLKGYYDFVNYPSGYDDESYFSYGGLVFARAKLSQSFYLQGEYSMVNFDAVNFLPKETLFYPTVGAGYLQQGYDWSIGMELLLILDDRVRDRLNIFEYWFTFSHNF